MTDKIKKTKTNKTHHVRFKKDWNDNLINLGQTRANWAKRMARHNQFNGRYKLKELG